MNTPTTCLSACLAGMVATVAGAQAIDVGPRPSYLIERLKDGELKDTLANCADQDVTRTDFSIGHRGAPLMFPEHTEEGYRAAARMGAGIVECDVTFTKDKQLVCRHAQDDLATTTNILATDLASNCTEGFSPASDGEDASADCRASDITEAEFKELEGKMDASDSSAKTVEAYMDATPDFRTDLYSAQGGTLLTHEESIDLFKELGVKFTPELKAPVVDMPYEGMSQEDYAQKMIDDYKDADVPPEDVWAQSFNLDDIEYWIENEPEFGEQAVYLDGRDTEGLDPSDPSTFDPSMQELADMGVNYIAPPIWMLIALDGDEIVPSAYAKAANEAGLKIISWSLERSGPLNDGGGWYYQTVNDVIDNDGDYYNVLDVLAQDVGIVGMFSDWPATVSYYASCTGMQ